MITRKDLLSSVYGIDGYKFLSHCNTTMDSYRNMAEKLGYLSKCKIDGKIKKGIFVINKHFPEAMTSTALRKEYDLLYKKKDTNGTERN